MTVCVTTEAHQPSQLRSNLMFAFADETGNTGANLFDEAQPDFYTGALVTRSNFDVVWGGKLTSICKRAGIDAVHASVLGVARLDTIAEPPLALLKKADARFFISRVEKRYLLATKVFDTFFDSGEIPAASWHLYNIRLLRLTLCFKVATCSLRLCLCVVCGVSLTT